MAAALCSAVNDWVAEGIARPRAAAARLDPGAAAQSRARGAEIERRRARPALRAGAAAGDGRHAARRGAYLADLCGGREARARRSACTPAAPIASRRRRRAGRRIGSRTTWPVGGVREPALSFIAEGVFQKFPKLEARADRVRLHLAADAAVAHQQDLARRARRGAVDRPAAGRHHARARALHAAAGRCAGGRSADAARARCEHIGSDRMLLFSTDYPHWHFDGDEVLPDGPVRRLCCARS